MEEGELLGREPELAALDAFLERAGSGWGGLVIEGEPGIGKTTLWREGRRRAESRGFTVLSSRPAEAEAKLSFAALGDAFGSLPLAAFDPLPAPQRHALDVALLRVEAGDARVEPRAVGSAVRGVLAGMASAAPVLIAIDDSQWLDEPSASALEFALRRLEDQPVGLLTARRPASPGTRDRLHLAAAQVLRLDRLSLAGIHELLKGRLGRALPRPLLLRVYEAARGNPFFALEIAREVLRSGVGPGDPLPVPKDLGRLLQRRLGRLSTTAQDVLLVAAELADPTTMLIAAALDLDPSPGLREAQEAELIHLERTRIRFAHPLYAAAVTADASLERLRDVHRRLADVVGDIEERARHLALATEAPSEELAVLLEQAAAEALRRGAPGPAAELTELALTRTPLDQDDRRQDRTLDLVERLSLAADSDRAREIGRASLPTLTSADRRVSMLLTLGELASWSSAPDWAADEWHPVVLAERALEAAGEDPSLAARAHTAMAGKLESDSDSALGHARQALDLIDRGADVSPAVHAQALAAVSRSELFRGDGLDVAILERAIDLERSAPPPLVHDRSTFRLAQSLKYVDEFEASRAGLQDARRAAADEGDDLSPVNILINLVILECWSGRWSEAISLGEELTQRVVQLGGVPGQHVALVAALTGDAETVRAIEDMTTWGGLYDVIRLRPLGLLALSQGDATTAHRHFRQALELLDLGGMREPAVFRIHADAIESGVRSGNIEEAARWAEALSAHARRSSIPWNRTMALRCHAFVAAAGGDLDEASTTVEAAVREHDRLPMPFELGRTLLIKGEIERRAKRKAMARSSLERALAIFEELGAPLWSTRAREQLQRIGLRRRAPDQLTETEQQVAMLAASGLTNRQVAAQLFMSPKTVEANLDRVYGKLGIRSRAQLGAQLASRGVPTQT